MNINIISNVRFQQTSAGDFRGDATVTTPDGKTIHAGLTGTALKTLLDANKAQGGKVRGYSREVVLKREVNGRPAGSTVTVVDYVTDVMRFSADLLGGFLDNPQGITLAGNRITAADAKAFTDGVQIQVVRRPVASDASESDLA